MQPCCHRFTSAATCCEAVLSVSIASFVVGIATLVIGAFTLWNAKVYGVGRGLHGASSQGASPSPGIHPSEEGGPSEESSSWEDKHDKTRGSRCFPKRL